MTSVRKTLIWMSITALFLAHGVYALSGITGARYTGPRTLTAGTTGTYTADFEGTATAIDADLVNPSVKFEIVESDSFGDTSLLNVTLGLCGPTSPGDVLDVDVTFTLKCDSASQLSGGKVTKFTVRDSSGSVICKHDNGIAKATVFTGSDSESGGFEIDVEDEPGSSNSGTEYSITCK